MPRISYVNGRYLPHADAKVHMEDRGYQFADGVYEVCEVARGHIMDMSGHLDRLDRSLRELAIAWPLERRVLPAIMREVVTRNRVRDGLVYLQVTRGVAPRDHVFPAAGTRPSLVVTAKRSDPQAARRRVESGIAVVTVPENRWERVDIKTVGLLPNVLARQKAKEAGAQEAWFVDPDGTVKEGAATNVWIVTADGHLVTRPADKGILRGITQSGVDVDSFLSLEPVVSNNRELGLEWDRGALRASASYFWSSSDLGSLLVLRNDVFEVERQPIEIEGFEASLAWRTPLPGLSFSGGYANLSGRTDSDSDGIVDEDLDGANISPDRINLAADYSAGPLSLRTQARFYLPREFNDVASATDFEGYTLLDAFLAYRSDIGEFALAASNLTDELYVTYDSDTVRVADNSRFYSGRGRTFTLSWRGAF